MASPWNHFTLSCMELVGTMSQVRVAGRPIPPQWGSVLFRLHHHPRAYDAPPWGASVRVVEPGEIKKNTHPKPTTFNCSSS